MGPRGKDAASPIASLAPTDLRVRAGRKDVAVVSVVHRAAPLRIGVIVDIGVHQTKATWDRTRVIVHNFVSQFPEEAEFSLVTFDDKVEDRFPLETRSHLDERLATLLPSRLKESKTGLYEALAAAIRAFGTVRPGDALLFVTAWEDSGSSDMQGAVAQWLSAAGVRLFGISFDSSRLPGPPLPGTGVLLQSFTPVGALAHASGGVWAITPAAVPGAEVLPQFFAAVVLDFYTVVLKLTQPLAKTEALKIEFAKGASTSVKPRVVLSYPQALYPCQ